MRGESERSWHSLPRKMGLTALAVALLLAAAPVLAVDYRSGDQGPREDRRGA